MKTPKSKFEKFSKRPVLNKQLLSKVKGGNDAPISSNCGHFYAISGECRKDGSSCWPF